MTQLRSLVVSASALLMVLAGGAQPPPYPPRPEVLAVLERISADSLRTSIERLTAFHTRHTFSDTISESIGVGAAIRWVARRVNDLNGSGRFTIEQFPWSGNWRGQSVSRVNLNCMVPGMATGRGRFIVGGHLDSRTVNGNDTSGYAPGADDNGSSCAALLELLRVLPDSLAHDLEIIWFTGEEQGLWGSEAYASYLRSLSARVDGMIALDMIGHIRAPDGEVDSTSVRLYAEGAFWQGGSASSSRNLQRYLRWVGRGYVSDFEMVALPAADRPGRGSDHLSFSAAGFPAVRVIERNEDLAYQHNANDLVEHLSSSYIRKVAVATFGGLITMLRAPLRPPAPVIELLDNASIRVVIGDSVELPEGGSFFLSIRNTTHADWDRIVELGTTRELVWDSTSPGQAYAFAVSRSNADGYPSPFSSEQIIQVSLAARERAVPPTSHFSVHPNPFNGSTVIEYEFSQPGYANLEIYDLSGRVVENLHYGFHEAGKFRAVWSPAALPAGSYWIRLTHDSGVLTGRITYLK